MQLFEADAVAGFHRAGWWSGETWADLLERHRREQPDRIALIDAPNRATFTYGTPRRLTWAQVGVEVDRLARVLFEHGVRRDQVVGLQLPNSVELPIALLAITRLGAICSPFPVQYRRHELAGMGAAAPLHAFVTTTDALGGRPTDVAVELRSDVPTLSAVLAFGQRPGAGYDLIDLEGVDDVDSDELTRYLVALEVDANECATLVWTSGTEGAPKGVPRAFGDWEVLGTATSEPAGLTGEDVLLNPFPMVNMAGIAGMFLPWLVTGATLVQHHPFDAEVFFEQLTAAGTTYTVAPPAILVRALDSAAYTRESLARVRTIGSGSAPLPPTMISAWRDRFDIEILNCFGSNEGISLVSDERHVPDPVQRARLFPWLGSGEHTWDNRAYAGLEMQLVAAQTGEVVTVPGTPGELWVRGPGVFSGYLAGTAATDPFDDAGRYRTGDVLELVADDDGQVRFLQYLDRAKDLIIRGGMNIAPAELEALIAGHPKVAEVAVIGRPDPALGERTHAVVVLHPGESLTLPELLEYLREQRIATYKLPESLQIVPSLPRNPVGKILKRELRTGQD